MGRVSVALTLRGSRSCAVLRNRRNDVKRGVVVSLLAHALGDQQLVATPISPRTATGVPSLLERRS